MFAPFFMNPLGGGFIIEGSGLWGGSAGDVLERTLGTPSNSRKFTARFVFKLGSLGTSRDLASANTTSTARCEMQVKDTGALLFYMASAGSTSVNLTTTALLRDPANFYDVVFVYDTALSTAADRVKIYVNGTRLTDFATETLPTQNLVSANWNTAQVHQIGQRASNSERNFDGYMALAMNIDGQALAPTSFGSVTDDGFWSISDVSELTFGTNGFLLEGGVNVSRGTDTQAGGTFAQQKTEFLSHFDGSDAATSSTDVSLAARTLTFNGNAQLDTAQKYFGTASLLLDGTADSVSAADNPAYDIAALDFTMDAWIRLASDASGTIMSKWGPSGQRGWLFTYDAGNSLLDWRTSTDGSNNANQVNETWNPDVDTWYHVAAERTGGKVHLYVDGTMLGSGTSNSDNVYANTAKFEVGSCENTGALTFNGHIDEPRYVRGVGLYGGSNFTPETAAYTDPATANPFIVTGTITATNDSPTNGGDDDEYGNYSTMNPLNPSAATLAEGNNYLTGGSNSTNGTLLIPYGQLTYFEAVRVGQADNQIGISVYEDTGRRAWRDNNTSSPSWLTSGGTAGDGTAEVLANGDVLGVAIDRVNDAIYFAKNNTWMNSGNPTSGSDKTGAIWTDLGLHEQWSPFAGSNANNVNVRFNFGATAFAYTPPTGYLPLATQNLPTPAVINYEDEYYIEAGISHSNGSTTAVTLPTSVAGGAMALIKRTDSTGGWYIVDTVRGANKFTFWDSAAAEDTSTFTDQNLTGTTLTLPSALATGTYMVEVFYQGSYFQIKTYSGNTTNRTISFDGTLDTAPGFMFPMERTGTDAEHLGYHISTGNTGYLQLQTTSAFATGANFLNNTSPTTTQFTLGTMSNVNKTGNTYVCYAWANSGPYAFGEFTGNNNADGPMTSINGSPKVLICKNTADGNAWFHQNNLSPVVGNPVDTYIMPNATSALSGANSTVHQDFVANGVKCRATSASLNASSAQILTMAFGIQPMTDGSTTQSKAK